MGIVKVLLLVGWDSCLAVQLEVTEIELRKLVTWVNFLFWSYFSQGSFVYIPCYIIDHHLLFDRVVMKIIVYPRCRSQIDFELHAFEVRFVTSEWDRSLAWFIRGAVTQRKGRLYRPRTVKLRRLRDRCKILSWQRWRTDSVGLSIGNLHLSVVCESSSDWNARLRELGLQGLLRLVLRQSCGLEPLSDWLTRW